MGLQLNLPPADIRLRRCGRGLEVYDPQRRKWLCLTPEEWVRQNFTEFMKSSLGVPASRIANEISIRLNGTLKRCDTVVYAPDLTPLAIVEYKAPTVTLTRSVFDQIARYNLVLGTPFLIVSNGLSHYCMSPSGVLSVLPTYTEMLSAIFNSDILWPPVPKNT